MKKTIRKHNKTLKKQQDKKPTRNAQSPEQEQIKQRLNDLCHKSKNEFSRSFYTHFHKRYLLAFAEFIDNPFCYDNGLLDLHHCQSKVKPLQKRQRVTLIKVVAALFSRLEVESYQVGFCNNAEFMDTVAHTYKDEYDNRESIRAIYEKMWGETICEKRYYAAINHLKLADLYCSESIYRYQPDKENQITDLDEEIPTIKSHASYKWFTHRFFHIFKLDEQEDVKKSKLRSINDRVKKGFTTAWVSYQAFSDSFYSFFWSKRKGAQVKRGDKDKYPQRKEPEWSIYGSVSSDYLLAHH